MPPAPTRCWSPDLHEPDAQTYARAAGIYEALSASAAHAPSGHGDDPETAAAVKLLARLGYLDGEASDATKANRLALLRFAGRFERIFELPLPHAPGASFIGAQADVAGLGVTGFGDRRLNAGGRGATFREAFESCAGEAAEYLAMLQRPNDPRVSELEGLAGFEPPERAAIAALLGRDANGGWAGAPGLQGLDLRTGAVLTVPAALVLRPPPDSSRSAQAETTGLAAGPDAKAALLSGLLEVIERDAVALWWHGGDPPATLQAESAAWPHLERLVAASRRDSERPHWFLDISSDIPVPVVACVSAQADGGAAIAGFCAHPDAETATARAFLEMAQMELAQVLALMKRQQQGEASLTPGDRAWIDRHEGLSTDCYGRLRADAARPARSPARPVDGADLLGHTVRAVSSRGLRPIACDLSPGNGGIAVWKVMVPGLQPIKSQWISPRLESAARKNRIDLRQARLQLAPI